MRKAGKRVLAGLAMMMTGASCSVIVGDTVPDFGCTIDAEGVCPTGLHCDTALQKCVATDGSTPIEEPTDDDAGDTSISHPETSVDSDAPSGPLDLGSACRLDTDCKSKLCASSTVLTTTIAPPATGPICTTPCCSSADCPSSFVCFNGGTGGSYCVPGRSAGRTVAVGTGGGQTAGSTCSGNSDCRSGLCGAADAETGYSVCLDTCCADAECASPTICRLGSIEAPAPAHTIWFCGPIKGSAFQEPGDTNCTSGGSSCTTNACSGSGATATCRPPCSGSDSCALIFGFTGGICIHGMIGTTETEPFCLKASSAGPNPVGTPCSAGSSCASGYCDQETTQCQNVCAKDSDCAPTEACRPSAVGTPYLRCVTAPAP